MRRKIARLNNWYVYQSKWWQRGLYAMIMCGLASGLYYYFDNEIKLSTLITISIAGIVVAMMPLSNPQETKNYNNKKKQL